MQAWLHRAWVARLLWPLSLGMQAVVALRRAAYRRGYLASAHPGVLTIVVGNVVLGGAGKTPTAIAVLRHLQAQGYKPGLISRGYGRRGTSCQEVLQNTLPQEVGDEPLLIKRATGVPVFVARQRIEAARALLARHPDTDILVCDDGLQHLALQRDIEICVFDERGVGNGWLLPAGPLRESWPRPVDLVLHTACADHSATGQPHVPPGPTAHDTPSYLALRKLADTAMQAQGQRISLEALQTHAVLAVAAIAKPEAFFAMLRARGLRLGQTQALPDHYDYATWQRPDAGQLTLLCTEKDAAKIWQHHPQAWAVPLVQTPEPGFFQALNQLIAARLSSRHGHQTT
jgi:tetraacyldisaccharide 4'-kinase